MAKKVTKKIIRRTAPKKDAASKIDSIYQGLINRLEKVENFTLEHAPDVCKEIVESRIIDYQNRAIMGALAFFLVGLPSTSYHIVHRILRAYFTASRVWNYCHYSRCVWLVLPNWRLLRNG